MRSCDIGCGHCSLPNLLIFFFKQKTADEMRISDWSSDVCSSDLAESPYQNAKEYIAAAKADAGQFVMAGTGSKQEDQIITVGLEQATGATLKYLPQKGGGDVAKQVVGKHATSCVNNRIAQVSLWGAGQTKPLCAFEGERIKLT